MNLRIITKNYAFNSPIQFPKNRFYCLWSSNRPPASVRVNASGSRRFLRTHGPKNSKTHILFFYKIGNFTKF